MKTVLFIGLVWPEPQSSAAGTRIVQLVQLFRCAGYEICFASAASKSSFSYPLSQEGVQEVQIQLNDSRFDSFVATLQPHIVIFDRFVTEEQYGWRIREQCPAACTVLDTEDLHFLRRSRQEAFKKDAAINYYNDVTIREIAAILRCDLSLIISRQEMELLLTKFRIPADLLYYLPFLEVTVDEEYKIDAAKYSYNVVTRREIAAILRCDLSLIISRQEMELLLTKFRIPADLLYYLPFLEATVDEAKQNNWPDFEQRKHFVFIGNFLHEPNWHSVRVLKESIWPKLRKQVPDAELHVYGAYPTEKVYQLHRPQEKFFIKGRAEDARKTLEAYRVLIAPIPFGAGVKGKFIDAMQAGTPSVTTTVGAEAMSIDGTWNGFIEDDPANFSDKSAQLYQHSKIWYQAQEKGIDILHATSNKEQFEKPF